MGENAKPASNYPVIVALMRAGLLDVDRHTAPAPKAAMRPAERSYGKPTAGKK